MSRHVIIIGDSISGGYTPVVQALLADQDVAIEMFSGGDSSQLLAGLPGWIEGKTPDLIQFNCGLHDLRIRLDRTHWYYQQPRDTYAANLRRIVQFLQTHAPRPTRLLWATTTPVITERIPVRNNVRTMTDVQAYNAAARAIMDEAGISLLDLCAVILAASPAECLIEDGVHMNERGNKLLAETVAASIRERLGQHEGSRA
jgi:lysophospholipase L1-like esterase